MSILRKIAGIIGSTLQLDVVNGGPRWKNNGGAMEVRNAADSGFAVTRVAAPVGANDAANAGNVGAPGVSSEYPGGTNVPATAKGVSFTADKTVTRYRLTATGLTVTLDSGDPDGTTYEFINETKSATPNTTFTPDGGLTINIAASYDQASITINSDWIYRAVFKDNGAWWIAS